MVDSSFRTQDHRNDHSVEFHQIIEEQH